ncbi:hypothetical protein HDU99_006026 [Rhizoclosmatium hyalinum]|nr:hypothetical protein HDU99_006026 [Rhizoclosmatium hyalinum]
MDSISTGAPFVQKRIDLSVPVKIGRKVNIKAGPEPNNGIFDSKVLSRNHAEIWFEAGKVWIKDVKSSNGTFINGVRLSEEGQPSGPHELKTGDTVEFGIDIMNDDGITVMYYKVSSKIALWDPSQGPLPAPLAFNTVKSGETWAPPPPKKAAGKMDMVVSMLDEEIRKASATSDQINKLKSELTDIDQLVATNTQLNPNFGDIGYPTHAYLPNTPPTSVTANKDSAIPARGARTTILAKSPAATAAETSQQQQPLQPQNNSSENNVPTDSIVHIKSDAVSVDPSLLTQLQARIAVLEADLSTTRAKLSEATKSLKETRELSQPIYRDNEDLKKKRQEVEAELVLVRRVEGAKVLELEKRCEALMKECTALKEREEAIIETSLATTTAQKQHLTSLETELSSLQASNTALSVKLATAQAAAETARHEASVIARADMDALETLARETEARLQLEVTRLETRVRDGAARIRELEEEVERVIGERLELEASKSEREASVLSLKSRIVDLEAKVKEGDELVVKKVAALEGVVKVKEGLVKEHEERARIKESLLRELESQLKAKDLVVKELEGKAKTSEAAAKEAQSRLQAKDVLVKEKEELAKAKEAALTESMALVKSKDALLKERDGQLKDSQEKVKEVEATVAKLKLTVKDLESQLKNAKDAASTASATDLSSQKHETESGLRQRKKGEAASPSKLSKEDKEPVVLAKPVKVSAVIQQILFYVVFASAISFGTYVSLQGSLQQQIPEQ